MTARLSTDTVRISVIDGDVGETCEVDFPWLRPAVSRTYLTPRARLARCLERLRSSAFAADLRRNGGLLMLCTLLLIAAALVLVATRGQYWTGTDWAAIPTGGAR